MFGIEPIETLQRRYQIIVCTLSASTYLITGGLSGCFSHIIVDEAGYADELDTLIPIVGLADGKTRVVLAGDPKQLGPMESVECLKRFKMSEFYLSLHPSSQFIKKLLINTVYV